MVDARRAGLRALLAPAMIASNKTIEETRIVHDQDIFPARHSVRHRGPRGRGRPARLRPLRMEADRDHPHHHPGSARRHDRRDGPAGGAAPPSRVGPVHHRGEQIRRRRHDRDDRLRTPEARRPHHHDRQSGAERDRLQHLPQHRVQARAIAAGQQPDPHHQHHLGASVGAGEVDPGADRIPQGQPRHRELCDPPAPGRAHI